MRQLAFEILRQKWRHLSIIILLLLANVVLSVVLSYQLPLLTDLQAKLSSMRRQSARTGQVDAAALYKKGTEDLEKLKGWMPEKREFAKVLGELYETAASNGVDVGSVSYKPAAIKEEPIHSYQLSYSVNGGYAAVKSYLSDLQQSQELIVVDSVTFSNSDLYIENVVMNLRVTIYLREGA